MVSIVLRARLDDRAPRIAPRHAERVAAYVLSAPAVLLIVVMLLGPALAVVALSFTDWQFGAPALNWIGLANFAHLAQDRVFWQSLGNTLVYVGVVVPASVVLGLGAALLIESGTTLRSFYRAVYFLPVTATLIAMAVVWQFILHPTVGLLNLSLELVGIDGTNWLKNRATALFALAGIGIWQAIGLNMVLFMAGLKAIPR